MKAPFTGTWWVLPARFLAGPSPVGADHDRTRDNIHSLLYAGIRLIVCLQEDFEPGLGSEMSPDYPSIAKKQAYKKDLPLSFYRSPIPDAFVPSAGQMSEILDRIDRGLKDDLPVYIHCRAGVGRTGTVVGCWLVRHGMSGEQSLAWLQRLRETEHYMGLLPSPGTGRQVEMVRSWRETAPHLK